MKKKIHLKKHIRINKICIYTLMIILILFFLFILLNNINKKYTPVLLEAAETEINKFSTIIINKAISQVLEDKINTKDLFYQD